MVTSARPIAVESKAEFL